MCRHQQNINSTQKPFIMSSCSRPSQKCNLQVLSISKKVMSFDIRLKPLSKCINYHWGCDEDELKRNVHHRFIFFLIITVISASVFDFFLCYCHSVQFFCVWFLLLYACGQFNDSYFNRSKRFVGRGFYL